MARHSILLLLGLALLGFAIRLGTLSIIAPPQLTGDELYYVDTALHIAQNAEHYSSMYEMRSGWPPLQSVALSLAVDPSVEQTYRTLSRSTFTQLILTELFIGSLLVPLVALLGWQLFDLRTGLWAGLCAALYPTFIGFSHYLWSETLFLVFEVAALAAAARVARTGSWGWVVTAAVGFGAAALTREVGALLACAVALWWLWTGLPATRTAAGLADRRRAALSRGLLLLVCTGAIIAPWTLRNAREIDRPVAVSIVGWMGMREGNTLSGSGFDWLRPNVQALRAFRARYFQIAGDTARQDTARSEALSLIRAEQPLWIFKKLIRNSAHLLAPDSFIFKKISRGLYGEVSPAVVRMVLLAAVASYLAVMCAGLLGASLVERRGDLLLLVLVCGVVIGVHTLANAMTRHRLPIVPLMMIYGAYAIQHWRRIPALPRAAKLVCAIVAALALLWPALYFAPDAASLWSTGSYMEPKRP